MASKKNTKAVEKRVAERKAFVAARPQLSKAEARKRFYVSTRAQELEAAGKEVNRAALRKKFELGQIEREGFMTARDIQRGAAARARLASASSGTLPGASTTQRPADTVRRSPSSMMDVRRQSVPGFKAGQVTPSSKKPTANNVLTSSPQQFKSRDKSKDPGWYKAINAPREAIGREIMGALESAQATFIAPVWNPTAGRLDKRLKVRQAGLGEGLMNVAAVAVGTPVGGKIATGVLRGVARRIPGSRLATRAVRGLVDEARLLLPGTRGVKLPPAPIRTGPRPTPPGGLRSPSRPGSRPAPSKPLELGPGPRALGPGPKPTPPKPTSTKPTGKGSTTKGSTTKGSTTKGSTTKKTSKSKAPTEKELEALNKKVEEGIRSATKTPTKKAPTKKTSTKKKSSPKVVEPVAAPAKPSPKMVTSTGRSLTPAGPARKPVAQRVSPTTKFKSQADYDAFMARGGKEQLRGMTVQEQQQFTQTNKPWIIGRSRARTEAGRARVKRAERRKAVVDRYNQIMRERNKRLGIQP